MGERGQNERDMVKAQPMPETPHKPASPALQVIDAYKRFGATHALSGVSITVTAGSVHALLGANGSGKSTLIRALAGFHTLDSGKVLLYGAEVNKGERLRFVHQDLALIPTLSVADNLALVRGYARGRLGSINWGREQQVAQRQLQQVWLYNIEPRTQISELSPVNRTLVAIDRALDSIEPQSNVLVLDEPTARLPQSESSRLIGVLKELRQRGLPILYVTHRLDELNQFADFVTVLRDGHVVFTGPWSATSPRELQRLITDTSGQREHVAAISPQAEDRNRVTGSSEGTSEQGPPALEVRNVSAKRIRNVSISVKAGELLGITGIVGSGRSELGRVIYGVQAYNEGNIWINGQLMPRPQTLARFSQHVGYVAQDRTESLLAGLTVEDNTTIASLGKLTSWYGVGQRRLRAAAQTAIRDFNILPPDPTKNVNLLSGGNQQKIAIARWLSIDLSLLILDEPTQSIDVGTKAELMTVIALQCKKAGLAVLWLESDVQELVKYADRILVMDAGRITAEFTNPPFLAQDIVKAIFNTTEQEG